MKLTEFEQHYQHLSKLVEGMLIKKRAEYATEEDRISNFKQMCSLTHHCPAENAANYWLKHISSTYDICVNASQGILPTQERLEEKITDSIAYLYLIYACLQEQMAQSPIQKRSNCPLKGFVSDDSTKDDTHTVSEAKTAQNAKERPLKAFTDDPDNSFYPERFSDKGLDPHATYDTARFGKDTQTNL